ncbi:GntR family transcriptional regulator [uncultured Sphaerochaeta sp.]|uniref:GntR family transcriptional regulator n=1 Tax=uncultured Sphaerochaeta sp. TaxID=886478 RepID=UPI002A0A1431|nr:GntR family transcriptional regulator [uncultured Sphaerochaeta sp.]
MDTNKPKEATFRLQDNPKIIEVPIDNQQRKADYLYAYLRNQIIQQTWSPGDRINDKEISETTKISRLSVREALGRLITDDIVEQKQWKGYFLRKFSPKEVRDLTSVRIALEQLALDNICKLTDMQLADYCALMNSTINFSEAALDNQENSKYMVTDFHFHEILYEASGNPMIAQFINNIMLKINIMRNISMGKKESDFIQAGKKSIYDHRRITEALANRNKTEACDLLYVHLANTFVDNILKDIEKKD